MRRAHSIPPITALIRGAIAGAAGTVALDAINYALYRSGGGTDDPITWEFSAGLDNFDDAPAPAKAGRLMAKRILGIDLPDSRARLVNNVTHWAYGIAWGAQYGLATRSALPRRPWRGPALGVAVWGSSYVTLPLLKLYKPIWQYDAVTLAKDLGPHLAYGVTTAKAFDALG